jgi:lysophospholipase L1-like esterase
VTALPGASGTRGLDTAKNEGAAPAWWRNSSALYLLVFVLSAAVLLYMARAGAAVLLVQAALLLFVAVSTLWTRAQYVDGRDGEQWVLPGHVALWVLGLSVLLFAIWRFGHLDGLGLAALFLFWLAASALVTRLREGPSRQDRGLLARVFARVAKRRRRLGFWLTVAGVLMLLFGVELLGRVTGSLLLWLLVVPAAGLLVVLPLGAALYSEAALTALSAAGHRRRPAWARSLRPWHAILGGGLGCIAAAVAAWMVTGNVLVLAALFVLFAVVAALVSSTHADVVILMAVVSLLGVTPQQYHRVGLTGASAPSTGPASKTLVAIGDSYLSGEGASVYYAGTDDGGGNQCRRAPTSWVAMAASAVGSGYQAMSFLACSGARTGNVLYKPRADIPSDSASQAFAAELARRGILSPQDDGDRDKAGRLIGQLDEWRVDQERRRLAPALVVVTLGGNDAGFSTIGQMCLAPGSCDDQRNLWMDSLDQVRDQLRLAYTEIDETFPDVPVLTVGYPDPIMLRPDQRCDQVALTYKEREFIHDFLTRRGDKPGLNGVIEETSAEFGFHYVDTMQDALSGQNLQLCDPENDDRPGLNFIGLRSVRGTPEQRFNPANWLHSSLHPNERGHAAMLQAFQQWMAQNAPLSARLGATRARELAGARARWMSTPSVAAAATADRAGPCDLFADDSTGCRPQGGTWALEQVRIMLLRGGLWLGLLAAFASWALAVGVFARHRSRPGHRRSVRTRPGGSRPPGEAAGGRGLVAREEGGAGG